MLAQAVDSTAVVAVAVGVDMTERLEREATSGPAAVGPDCTSLEKTVGAVAKVVM